MGHVGSNGRNGDGESKTGRATTTNGHPGDKARRGQVGCKRKMGAIVSKAGYTSLHPSGCRPGRQRRRPRRCRPGPMIMGKERTVSKALDEARLADLAADEMDRLSVTPATPTEQVQTRRRRTRAPLRAARGRCRGRRAGRQVNDGISLGVVADGALQLKPEARRRTGWGSNRTPLGRARPRVQGSAGEAWLRH